ncbi:MAG: hypothetical protein ACK53Y_08520, partial [bacterium]
PVPETLYYHATPQNQRRIYYGGFYFSGHRRNRPGNMQHMQAVLEGMFPSEITTGDGIYITEDAWTGRYLEQPFKDKFWPAYKKPSASS